MVNTEITKIRMPQRTQEWDKTKRLFNKKCLKQKGRIAQATFNIIIKTIQNQVF